MIALFLSFLLWSLPGNVQAAEFQTARIVSIQDSSVTKSRFTGESFGEVSFVTSRPYQARAFEIRILVDGVPFDLVREVRSQADDMSFLKAGDSVEVRVKESKNRVDIRRPDGKVWKTRILRTN